MIVITLTKNSALTIKDTIESIKSQKFKNILWFIFDERSKDATLKIIKDSNINFKIFRSNSNSIYDVPGFFLIYNIMYCYKKWIHVPILLKKKRFLVAIHLKTPLKNWNATVLNIL